MPQEPDALWGRIAEALDKEDWEVAEGWLYRLRSLMPDAGEAWGYAIADALGHVLLQQGRLEEAEAELTPLLDHPRRSFWVSHKLGDLHRLRHELVRAGELFRRSIKEGSDSPLTYRNLLEVCEQIEAGGALQECRQWQASGWPRQHPCWQGALEAASRLPTGRFTEELFVMGLADIPLRRRCLEARLQRLDLVGTRLMLDQIRDKLFADGLSEWEQWLSHRLVLLGCLNEADAGNQTEAGGGAQPCES
jgi:hypothetical protein